MIRKWSGLTSKKPFVVNNRHSHAPKKIFFWSFFFIIVTLIIVGFNFINPNWSDFFLSFHTLGRRIKQLLSWDFTEFNSVPFPQIQAHSFMWLSLNEIWQTFIMAFSGTVIGILIAFPVAIFASKNIFHNKAVNGFLKTILAVFRTVPVFVFSLILVGFFGPNTLTVTIAVIIFTFSITSKLIYDRIEQVDMGPYEVLAATGASKFNCFRAAIFPQIMRHLVSTGFYGLEVNIRYISIIGLVAKVGIGAMIDKKMGTRQFNEVGWLLFLLISIIIVIELLAFIVKKWVMTDQDKILDRKVTQKFTRKTILLNKLPAYFYWRSQMILSTWKLEKQELINKIKNVKDAQEKQKLVQDLKTLKNNKKIIIRNEVSKLKAEIKQDKINYQQSKKAMKKLYVFDQALLQNIRLDQITKKHFITLVNNDKTNKLSQQRALAHESHQIFKQQLTVDQVYQAKPFTFIKRMILALIILALFIYSFSQIKFGLENSAQIAATWQHIKDMFNISWSSLFTTTGWGGNPLPFSVAYLIFETIMIAIAGTLLGVIMALLLGMLSSQNVTNKYVSKIFWVIATIIRPIPSYIYAVILIALTGLSPFTGVIALGIATAGMLSKYIREIFNDIDTSVLETLTASGANYFQRFRYGVLPQVSSNIMSWIIYRFNINITEAAILGVVGAGNFGFMLNSYFTQFLFHDFGALLFGMIITTLILELLINVLRNKIKHGIDPNFVYRFKKLVKRNESPWYVINGRLLGKNTTTMSFEELKALFKYTNVTIFRNAFKLWIKSLFKKQQRKKWKQAYAYSYCQYFHLILKNDGMSDLHDVMVDHHKQYVEQVKALIQNRRKFLRKNYLKQKEKIKTLKKQYNANLETIKTLEERRFLKNEFKNNITLTKNIYKSVKLRHE